MPAASAATPAATTWWTGRYREAVGTGCAAGLAGLVFWLAHAGLSDDAYITLDYARNLAERGSWGLIPGVESNTATSPLNVLLLAAVMALARLLTGAPHPVAALGVVTIVALAATGWWWMRVTAALRVSLPGAALGIALLVLSPLALSAVGLETAVLVALLLGMLSETVPKRSSRPLVFGILAGLAILARLDAVVFVLVLVLGTASLRRGWRRILPAASAVALPWFAWSWWFLGSAIPTTLAIKQLQSYPEGWTFVGGPVLLLRDSTLPAVVSLLPAALGLVALAVWLGHRVRGGVSNRLVPLARFAGAGVVYFAVYCALAVPPYLWYYVPTVAALSLFLAAALIPAGQRPARHGATLVGVLLVIGALGTDLTHGLPWRSPPIFGNYAEPDDYARVGRQLPPLLAGAAVESPGELGTLIYHCRCAVTDQFSDPGRALPFVEAQIRSAGPVARSLLELNYRRLDRGVGPVPAKYRLDWAPGWVAERPGVWNVSSPASGRGHLTLSGS